MIVPNVPTRRQRSLRAVTARALGAAALVAALAGCQHDRDQDTTQSIPGDYRLRHPIAITEGARTVELFIGSARGGLTPAQRADVAAFALSWKREATGGIVIDLPTGTSSRRAARDAAPEIRGILVGMGVPGDAIAVQSLPPGNPNKLATVKLKYPKMVAAAGPCGLWPNDLGPSIGSGYSENRQHWNFGCSSQRDLAAMVENPTDLVQPRGETPIYAARRTAVIDKYRKGESPATIYPSAGGDGKISDVGK